MGWLLNMQRYRFYSNMENKSNGQLTTDNIRAGMHRSDALMQQAAREKVFPGAVLLVSQSGTTFLHRAYGVSNLQTRRKMTAGTVFDLASLTKPLATALAIMILIQQKRVGLEQTLGVLMPVFRDAKSSIRVKHLLYHNSGLADYRPFYREIEHLEFGERKKALRRLLAQEPLIHPVGTRTVYSDVGFMILEWLIEHISGKRLDRFVSESIYGPLGLENLFFVDLSADPPRREFAATERCSWRNKLLDGEVHDENAYVVGGIQGHAGLFGNAADLHRLLTDLLSAFHGHHSEAHFRPDLVRHFFTRLPDTDKALGFDCPSAENSSAGKYFSVNSVGHLGFTGTSFWMDPGRSIIVILLTNRIHPTRENDAIKAFRPKLHDAVMESL
jgi:CubicO group peptidase (beta-lactamase class C family)